MANYVTLTDTGYYDTAESGDYGAPATEEQAYGSDGSEGTALNLHVNEISVTFETMGVKEDGQFNLKVKDSDGATIDTGRFELNESNKVGIVLPVWTIKGFFDMSATTTDARDFGRLVHMYKTKGYKRLGITTADTAAIIGYSHYGEREYDADTTKTILYIKGRIKNFRPSQKYKEGQAVHKVPWTLTFVEMG